LQRSSTALFEENHDESPDYFSSGCQQCGASRSREFEFTDCLTGRLIEQKMLDKVD
jgi:hypothetical protein